MDTKSIRSIFEGKRSFSRQHGLKMEYWNDKPTTKYLELATLAVQIVFSLSRIPFGQIAAQQEWIPTTNIERILQKPMGKRCDALLTSASHLPGVFSRGYNILFREPSAAECFDLIKR